MATRATGRRARATKGRGRPAGDAGAARAALLAAARDEFAARGYAGARTREIVAAAGTSFPTLYHHFGSKAGLYSAVAEEVNDHVLGAFADAIAGHDDVGDRIDALLVATIALQADDPSIADFVVGAPVDFARHAELSVAAPQMHRLRSFVGDLASGTLPPGLTREDAARTTLVLIFGLSRLAATASPQEYAAAAETARRMLRGLLDGPG